MMDESVGAEGPASSFASQAAYNSRSYIPELDGLRAISILIVISVHAKDRVWGWLAGHLGVTIFFVLSGYLITMLALREERSRGALNLPAFFARRVFRLFPLYYLVLAAYCFLIFGLGWSPEKRPMLAAALPYYLVYFQEYPFIVGIQGQYSNIPFYQSWTLGIEEKFYLVWPFVCFVAWYRARNARLLGSLMLWALLMLAPVAFGNVLGRFIYPYSHILLGCLVALLLDDPAWFPRLEWLGRPVPGLVTPALLAVLHFTHPYAASHWPIAAQNVYSLATALFLVSLVLGNGVANRLLRTPSLVEIGKLSYAMYLIHLFMLNVADKLVKPGSGYFSYAVLSYLIACLLSIAGAYVLNRIVERPCIAFGRRVSNVLKSQAQARPTVDASLDGVEVEPR